MPNIKELIENAVARGRNPGLAPLEGVAKSGTANMSHQTGVECDIARIYIESTKLVDCPPDPQDISLRKSKNKSKFTINLRKEIASLEGGDTQLAAGQLKQQTPDVSEKTNFVSSSDQEDLGTGQSQVTQPEINPLQGDEKTGGGQVGDSSTSLSSKIDLIPPLARITRIKAQIFPLKKPGNPARNIKLYISDSDIPEVACDRHRCITVVFNTISSAAFRKAMLRNKAKIGEFNFKRLQTFLALVEDENQMLSNFGNRERATLGYLCYKAPGEGTMNFYDRVALLSWCYDVDERRLFPVVILSFGNKEIEIKFDRTENSNPKANEYVGYYDPGELWRKSNQKRCGL